MDTRGGEIGAAGRKIGTRARRGLRLLVTAGWLAGVAALLPAQADETGPLSIRMPAQVSVEGNKIVLGEVARIKGPDAFQEIVGKVFLAHAPPAGKEKVFRGAWIESKIRARTDLPEGTLLDLPERIHVQRSFQTIEESDLLERFEQYLSERTQGAEIRVSRFRVIGNGPVPEGEVELEILPLYGERWEKHVTLKAAVRVDGREERRLSLSGWVDRFEEVVCAARRLPKHSILSPEDITVEIRNVSRLRRETVVRPETVPGTRLRRSVQEGTVLSPDMLESPPVVKKGDQVTMVAQSGNLVVTTLGIVQAAGAIGDAIPVKNAMSDKVVTARIVDGSTVQVRF